MEPINYYYMPNKQGDQKFDHSCPQGHSFRDKGEHLILVLLCKANLECKEICASDWLKPTSTLFYIPNLALHIKKPIYSSSIGSVEEH